MITMTTMITSTKDAKFHSSGEIIKLLEQNRFIVLIKRLII